MKEIINFVVLAVGAVISAAIIIVTINITDQAKDMVKSGTKEAAMILSQEDAVFASDLKDHVLYGATIKELAIKYLDSGYLVQFVTKACPSGFYSVEYVDNTGSAQYVSDDTKFTSRIIRNDNDVILGVQFTEQGVSSVGFDLTAAKSTNDTVELAVTKEQLKLFRSVNKYQNLCSECLKVFNSWSDVVSTIDSETLDLLERQLTGRSDSGSLDYSSMTVLMQQKTDFLNSLADTIENDWVQCNWFDALLYFDDSSSGNNGLDDDDDEIEDDDDEIDDGVLPDDGDGDDDSRPGYGGGDNEAGGDIDDGDEELGKDGEDSSDSSDEDDDGDGEDEDEDFVPLATPSID